METDKRQSRKSLLKPVGKATVMAAGAFTILTVLRRRDEIRGRIVGRLRELEKTQAALSRSERKYRELFNSMARGVVYHAADGRIISANPSAERILGLTLARMRGRTPLDPRWKAIREDGSDFPGDEHPAMEALRTGQPVRDVIMGVFNPREDRHRWINVNAVPRFREGEAVPYQVYATFDDITGRREVEADLARSNATQTVLNGLLRLAVEDLPMDEQLKRALEIILAAPFLPIEPKGGIFLVEENSQTLTLRAGKGLSQTQMEMCGTVPFGQCLCGRAAADGRMIFTSTVDHRHDHQYEGMLPHGHYAVPILSRAQAGKVLGVIVLYVKSGHARRESEENFLQATADTMAGIIERRQVQEALKQAKFLSDALNRVNTALISTLDLDRIMHRVVREATEAIGAEATIVLLHEDDSWVIKYVYGTMGEFLGVKLTKDEARATAVAEKTGSPIVVNDAYNDPRVNREVIKKFRLRSFLVAPLIIKEGVIGSLFFLHQSAVVPFKAGQIDFAEKLAASVSLVIENSRLYAQERGIAATLQETLLAMPKRVDAVELGYLYQSAGAEAAAVGGDFYDVFEMGQGKIAMVIGDVSGKGLGAARSTELVKNTIKAYVYRGLSPAEALSGANDVMLRSLEPTVFVTVFLGVFDEKTNRLTYCAAGHPPPLVKQKSGHVRMLVTDSPAIGVLPDAVFVEHLETLAPGDCVVGYTDGVTEARRGRDLYGEERLVGLLERLDVRSTRKLPQLIFEDVTSFSGGALVDDVALLAIRPRERDQEQAA